MNRPRGRAEHRAGVATTLFTNSRNAPLQISGVVCENHIGVITSLYRSPDKPITQGSGAGNGTQAGTRQGVPHMHDDTTQPAVLAENWQDDANCLGVDPDLFFPERGASTREAKEVCRGCVVREQCLEFALQNGEKFGIWGGLSERERRRIRRQRAQAARSIVGA
ncbi:MAG TPA: WhiB family transcriptional regulator [Vicinamibacterales bacterium]|nr:WhiB family transcriptional regulator [Vicinamibacterales bacterium]